MNSSIVSLSVIVSPEAFEAAIMVLFINKDFYLRPDIPINIKHIIDDVNVDTEYPAIYLTLGSDQRQVTGQRVI
jgi:hypothetical protein